MRSTEVNLARRPFVNQRPVTRLAWLLWGLGLVLVKGCAEAHGGKPAARHQSAGPLHHIGRRERGRHDLDKAQQGGRVGGMGNEHAVPSRQARGKARGRQE